MLSATPSLEEHSEGTRMLKNILGLLVETPCPEKKVWRKLCPDILQPFSEGVVNEESGDICDTAVIPKSLSVEHVEGGDPMTKTTRQMEDEASETHRWKITSSFIRRN